MSKSNVNPNHYKVAGRERQGEDILQQRHKQKLAESLARERFEPRLPNPAYTRPGRDEFGPEAPAGPFPESSAKAGPFPESSAKQVPPTNLTARKKPAAARSKAKAAADAAKPGAKKRAPAPTTRRAPIKAQASAKAEKRATAQKRASSRNDGESRPAARATAGAQRKKPSNGRRGKR
jgi:hypothetical protein